MSSLTQLGMLPQPSIPGGMAVEILLSSCYEPLCGARVMGRGGRKGKCGERAECLEDRERFGGKVRLCLTCMEYRDKCWCRAGLVTAGLIPYPERKRDVLTARDWGKRGEKLDVDKGEMKVD